MEFVEGFHLSTEAAHENLKWFIPHRVTRHGDED